MGAFGLILGVLQSAGLYVQLTAGLIDRNNVDNHVSGNALFTEIPHDITTRSGEDVEMACSFRGAGFTSYSLEIQWWYIKNHRNWPELPAHVTNNVVKVAGSNISHKLRLSSVKPADEGTYECHVIDHSGPVAQQYRVQAYLKVEPERSQESSRVQLQEPQQSSQGGRRPSLPADREQGGEEEHRL